MLRRNFLQLLGVAGAACAANFEPVYAARGETYHHYIARYGEPVGEVNTFGVSYHYDVPRIHDLVFKTYDGLLFVACDEYGYVEDVSRLVLDVNASQTEESALL